MSQAELEALMATAIAEAKQGLGHTSPNPSVGALLVKDGAVLVRCLPSSEGTAVVSVTLIVPPAL